jgi:hypothetical protein
MVLDGHGVPSHWKRELAGAISDSRGLERKRAVIFSSKPDSPFVIFGRGKVVNIIPVRTFCDSGNCVASEGRFDRYYSAHESNAKAYHVNGRFLDDVGGQSYAPPDAFC